MRSMDKKRYLALVALLLFLPLYACSEGSDSAPNAGNSSGGVSASTSQESQGLSDAEIEALVVSALYDEIGSTYDTADPGSCRYSINKTEKSGGKLLVYGEVTLYDKYGKVTGGWVDGSGTPFRTFDITISESSRDVTSCEID